MSREKTVAQIFGQNVFNDKVMRERLPKKVYEELKKTIEGRKDLDPTIADVVAGAMKEWAVEKGATHYTHWFQPLTGSTAEKHDSFITAPKADGSVLMEFSGKELIKGEPDASSFPSGGLRATFEARGYTAWDCTSPAFVREDEAGAILCVPTAFCSYTGEALDQKTPLLRSMSAIETQALRLLRLFGNTTSRKVIPSVGVEQEYFIVDREKYLKRKDLIYTGRTLFGAMPPKGQELDDHYFGVIRPRIGEFMKDVNEELWKLGVSAKTQHNEVAPAQHELAPIYAECNVAADHNQIIMETLKRIANKHGLQCLLHEKPFAGVNGSGKHNNWSLTTDDGINLLDPGKKPHENKQFQLVLACVLKAVDTHADLLRESAADVGNENRLGANEAPPAIISVFLGTQLEDVLEQVLETGEATHSLKSSKLETGVKTLPDLVKDATDRNRTSPFAFTGNKFEFRMVGSRDSVAECNVVLNTIVAEAFCEACDIIEAAEDKDEAIHNVIVDLISQHYRIVFNGNGYSDEWVEEAASRGLPNIKSMVEAIPALITPKAINLFQKFGVFTEAELQSRAEIQYEAYSKALNIEVKAMLDIAGKSIIPAVLRYAHELADTVLSMQEVGITYSAEKDMLKDIARLLEGAKAAYNKLKVMDERAQEIAEGKDRAEFYKYEVEPVMMALRKPIDELEMIVDKEAWPMPSYGDLLFEV